MKYVVAIAKKSLFGQDIWRVSLKRFATKEKATEFKKNFVETRNQFIWDIFKED